MFDAINLTAEARRLIEAHLIELAHLTGLPPAKVPADSPLARMIALLCDAANGTLGECRDDATDEAVSLAWDDLYTALTSSAAAYSEPEPGFWTTPLGRLLASSRLWLDCDELMTLSDAALLLRGASEKRDLKWLNDQMTRGRLTRYEDPDEPNPTKAGRVRRSEVEAIREAR